MRFLIGFGLLLFTQVLPAQLTMSPELMWSLGRVNGQFLYNEGKNLCYTVTTYDIEKSKGTSFIYSLPLDNLKANLLNSNKISANSPVLYAGNNILYSSEDKMMLTDGAVPAGLEGAENIVFSKSFNKAAWSERVKLGKTAADLYPEYSKTTARIYDDLMVRHWDTWEDGTYNHIFYAERQPDGSFRKVDIMPGEMYNAPTMPFGGAEDIAWSPDEKIIAYVSVKKAGKEYATSTNSDIYFYDISTGKTTNFTAGMNGYDKSPTFSPDGKYMAWTSMARDGYEADKNNIYVADLSSGKKYNLTSAWDGTADQLAWSTKGDKLFFTAPVMGAQRIMELTFTTTTGDTKGKVRQITTDDVDYHLIGQAADGRIICNRTDFNHANEVYAVDATTGKGISITHVNDALYSSMSLSRTEKRMITTTDGKKMLTWVLYPPDFDPNKKYPTLLYCQGGPQSAITQFYSYRWNLSLMAANGYIVVAPSRRGMPGFGADWNEAISGDWGGQPIRDYLSAIDAMKKEPFVDSKRLGAVGASYGGYSVYMLAGVHEKRFKTFISHCGVFDTESFYGTTEEMWFANFDLKAPYWQQPQVKGYTTFNPKKYIAKWDTPILIFEGEKDFRIPYTQGLEAFQLARLRGIRARYVDFSDEGHWVSKPHNSLVWHNEFFRWLKETL